MGAQGRAQVARLGRAEHPRAHAATPRPGASRIGRPPSPADLSPGLRLHSRATHWSLYVPLMVLLLLGWVAASGFGATPYLFGVIPLPALIAKDKPTAEAVGGVHACCPGRCSR